MSELKFEQGAGSRLDGRVLTNICGCSGASEGPAGDGSRLLEHAGGTKQLVSVKDCCYWEPLTDIRTIELPHAVPYHTLLVELRKYGANV